MVDETVTGDNIDSLQQNEGEALAAYYNRALAVLHRAGCRDASTGVILTIPESTVLGQVVRQFVKGLRDPGLRREAIGMSALSATGLRAAFQQVRTAQTVIDERKAEEEELAFKNRARFLEDVVTQQNLGI